MQKSTFYYSAKVIHQDGTTTNVGFNSDKIISYYELKDKFKYLKQDMQVQEVIIHEEPEIIFYE